MPTTRLALPLAALLLPGLARAQAPAAVLAAATGKVSSAAGPLKIGAPISSGDELTVTAGDAIIAFSDGTKIRLSDGAKLKVGEKSVLQTSLNLLKGKLEAWVKLTAGRRFRVRSGVAVASVRGTVFSAGNGAFALFRGALGVTDDFGRSILLSPGQLMATTPAGLGDVAVLPPGAVMPVEPVVPLPPVAAASAPPSAAAAKKAADPQTAPESLPAEDGETTPPASSPTQETDSTNNNSSSSGETQVVSPSSPP